VSALAPLVWEPQVRAALGVRCGLGWPRLLGLISPNL
jgi:hypothetical protein